MHKFKLTLKHPHLEYISFGGHWVIGLMSQVGGGFGYFCLLSAGKWGIGLDPKGSGASQTWVEFVVGSPLLCGYFSYSSGFPPFTKTNIPNSNLTFETVDRKSNLMELSPLNPIIIMMAATIPLQIYGDSLCFAQRTWKEWRVLFTSFSDGHKIVQGVFLLLYLFHCAKTLWLFMITLLCYQ